MAPKPKAAVKGKKGGAIPLMQVAAVAGGQGHVGEPDDKPSDMNLMMGQIMLEIIKELQQLR